MEYFTYILIIFGIVALCIAWLHYSAPFSVEERKTGALQKGFDTVKHSAAKPATPDIPISAVEAVKAKRKAPVPIPWGWPGHHDHEVAPRYSGINAQPVHGVSESLHRFVDRLMSEKQTIEDQEYRLRKDASLKALIEDRYGKSRVGAKAGFNGSAARSGPAYDEPLKMDVDRDVKTPWGW